MNVISVYLLDELNEMPCLLGWQCHRQYPSVVFDWEHWQQDPLVTLVVSSQPNVAEQRSLANKLIANRWAWGLMPWQGAWALQAEAGSYPWQPCELKPPLLATTNWHRHTKTRSVEKCLPDPYTYQKGLKLLKGREDWELESAKIRFNTGKMICQDQLENKHKAMPVNGRCLAPSRIMSRMLRGKPAKPQWKLATSIGLILTLYFLLSYLKQGPVFMDQPLRNTSTLKASPKVESDTQDNTVAWKKLY